jgi:hypothetical protein
MSKLKLVSARVPDPVKAAAFFEGVHGLKPDGVRGLWAWALDRLIAMQKRRARSALQRYYDEHLR